MNEPLRETSRAEERRNQRALLTGTQELLWISSSEDAQAVAVRLVEALGGRVVPAEQADSDALPVDVSFGHGAPLRDVGDPGRRRGAVDVPRGSPAPER